MKKVGVIGLWHLGLVACAGLSDLGYEVMGFDPDSAKIKEIHQGRLPIFEPGLDDLIQKHSAAGNLKFSDNPKSLEHAETVLMAYDTPVDEQDQIDLSLLESSLGKAVPFLKSHGLLVIHSQVPVGTTEKWQSWIEKERPGEGIHVAASPENLRLGQAIDLFKKPDMIVIGAAADSAREKALSFFSPFASEKILVSPRTAEMAKHALNVFFATSISFANEIGNLCDAVGADGMEIAKILRKDSRIGPKAQVRPGLGFAGATLARDLRALENLGKKKGVPTRLAETVLLINEKQLDQTVALLETCVKELSGKKICVWGLTYKPGTSTLRRSSSLEIIRRIKARGALVTAHDPKADLSEIKEPLFFKFETDPFRAAEEAEALLLLTEWPEYRQLDFKKLKAVMKTPLILDAKNHLDRALMVETGFQHFEIGRGQLTEGKSCCV